MHVISRFATPPGVALCLCEESSEAVVSLCKPLGPHLPERFAHGGERPVGLKVARLHFIHGAVVLQPAQPLWLNVAVALAMVLFPGPRRPARCARECRCSGLRNRPPRSATWFAPASVQAVQQPALCPLRLRWACLRPRARAAHCPEQGLAHCALPVCRSPRQGCAALRGRRCVPLAAACVPPAPPRPPPPQRQLPLARRRICLVAAGARWRHAWR